MQSSRQLTVFLCCLWAATLLYGEMIAYWIPLFSCSWPHSAANSPSDSNHYMKVALLADPQIMDSTSLGLPPESFALKAAEFYTDLYMRRSFQASILPFKPDLIIFLGDNFDGGAALSEKEWNESLRRFRHIFDQNEKGRHSRAPFYYLSGNHDIGYSVVLSRYPQVVSRYDKEFGTRNYKIPVGNVDFIVIDAQTLDGPEHGKETSLSWDFIKNVSKGAALNPKVLLTHIPLYRPDETSCGPHRSSPIINQRFSYAGASHGISYQNYLSKETSSRLLDLIRPILVLSGHDHDQCTVNHSTTAGTVTEHTLGTVSWQQGNLYPSFMLLSVSSSSSSKEANSQDFVSTSLCFLPVQIHIYIWYICLFIITILLLILWPTNGFGLGDKITSYFRTMKNNVMTSTKEKDEDENCEYEMIWDAEGSMHLIKKPLSKVPTSKPDVGLGGRSNVVSRPTAKKHLQDQEASVSLEMGSELKLDNNTKVPRPSRSFARRLIQQFFRVSRLLAVIAAVNVPLYVMLLFKDWIE